MRQKPRRSNAGQLVDWLGALDKERSSERSRAETWLNYSWFSYARYPHLRPPGAPRGDLIEALQRFGYEPIANSILGAKERIATAAPRVIKGLPRKLQIQLAALEIDIENGFEIFFDRRRAKGWSQQLGREGPRRQRMLGRKLEKARRALNDLLQYARDIDPSLGFPFRSAADDCLKLLSELKTDRSFDVLPRLHKELQESTEDPTAFAMVKLYWFFRSGCGLTGDESEIRTGLVRNGVWTRFGFDIEPVQLTMKQEAQSEGCQAVHEAVRRFSQGTAR